MKLDGTIITPPVHQDNLRIYTGKKDSKYLHNNRIYDIRPNSEYKKDTEEIQEELDTSEGTEDEGWELESSGTDPEGYLD